jgi:uncharacterized protein YdaU (DUF1376 family)
MPAVRLITVAGEHAEGGPGRPETARVHAEMLALTESEWERLVTTLTATWQQEGQQLLKRRVDNPEALEVYVVTVLAFGTQRRTRRSTREHRPVTPRSERRRHKAGGVTRLAIGVLA